MQAEAWASIPTVAPYSWAIYRDGILTRAERIPGSDKTEKLATIGPPPYVLKAEPQRAGMPKIELDLDAGMEPIWLHRVAMVYPVSGAPDAGEGPTRFEHLIMGRRHPDGREEVIAVYPDGEVALFGSLAEALA